MKKLTILTAILISSFSFAQVPNYVPTNGLVGWWPFNGNANDESGNGNNGTVNGATLTSDRNGIANSAYAFDGIDDFIQCAQSGLAGNQSTTIGFWIKTSTNTSGHVFSYGANGNSGSDNRVLINPYGSCSGSIAFDVYNSGIAYTTSFTNSWDFYVVIYNNLGSNISSSSFYKNGVLMLNNCFLDNSTSPNFQNTYPITFGRYHGNIATDFINATIDEIGFWNRPLTQCEIKNLYNSGVPNSTQTQTALDTYTWPVNNQIYTQSGTYSDTLVNAAGCDSIVTLNLTLSFTGINDINTSTLSISPNPTAGDFTITGLELYKISTIRITDVNGKLVKELDPTASKFTLGTAKPGVYFLTITAGNKQEVIKLIKE